MRRGGGGKGEERRRGGREGGKDEERRRDGMVSRGGGGRGCFDLVLVGEGIIFKRWTHDSRQHVHCPTSGVFRVTVLSPPPPAPPGQDSFELKSSDQPLKQAAKSASSRIR